MHLFPRMGLRQSCTRVLLGYLCQSRAHRLWRAGHLLIGILIDDHWSINDPSFSSMSLISAFRSINMSDLLEALVVAIYIYRYLSMTVYVYLHLYVWYLLMSIWFYFCLSISIMLTCIYTDIIYICVLYAHLYPTKLVYVYLCRSNVYLYLSICLFRSNNLSIHPSIHPSIELSRYLSMPIPINALRYYMIFTYRCIAVSMYT